MNRLMIFLDAIRDHLDLHQLPPVASVRVGVGTNPVAVQLDVDGLAEVARALLVWANTLDDVTALIWRTRDGESVHLELSGRTPCGIPIQIYSSVPFREDVFPDLAAGMRQDMPVFVLRGWAADAGTAA